MDSEQLLLSFIAEDKISSVLQDIGSKVEQFVGQMSGMGGVAGDAFGLVAKAALAAGVAVAGIAVGIFAAADKMATETAKYSVEVERNSFLLNGNTTLLQTLYRAGDILGQGIDQINVRLTFFNKTLEGGAPTLKKFGLTLDELGISTTNADQALLQLADKFHASNDEGLKTAATTALFGRNAAGMIPFLNLGSEGINKLTKEFQDFGLVLNGGQLQVSALAGVVQERLGLVLKGLATTVGAELAPAFIVFWSVLSKVLTGGAGLVEGFTAVVAKAVIWLAAFIAAITGTNISVDDFIKGLDSASTMLSLNAGAAQDAGNNIDQMGQAVKGSTTALENQITALQDQQKAFDDAMRAETDAINAQKSAYDDLLDSQTASLNEQIRQMDLANQQANAQQGVADIQSKIAADQAALARAPYLGITDTSSLYKQLETDQDALAKATNQIAFTANKTQLEDKIRTLAEQKKAQDNVYADQIKSIQAVTKATDDAYADRIRILQEEVKQINQANAANAASTKAANAANLTSAGDMTKGIKDLIGNLKTTFTGNFDDMKKSGTDAMHSVKDTVGQVKDAFDQLGRAIFTVNTFFGTFHDLVSKTWDVFSLLMGPYGPIMLLINHIGDVVGVFGAIGRALDALNTFRNSGSTGHFHMALPGGAALDFDQGGMVPGPIGMPHVAVVHGGEFIQTPQMQAQGPGGSDESVAILRQILWALTRSGGSSTGVEALVNKLVEQAAYARSRGTMTYAAG